MDQLTSLFLFTMVAIAIVVVAYKLLENKQAKAKPIEAEETNHYEYKKD
ncbi:hypothetical protein [Shimazuella kribbensis]|nr:hypothetical protein [Shimazuella kribbensis]